MVHPHRCRLFPTLRWTPIGPIPRSPGLRHCRSGQMAAPVQAVPSAHRPHLHRAGVERQSLWAMPLAQFPSHANGRSFHRRGVRRPGVARSPPGGRCAQTGSPRRPPLTGWHSRKRGGMQDVLDQATKVIFRLRVGEDYQAEAAIGSRSKRRWKDQLICPRVAAAQRGALALRCLRRRKP